MAGVEHFGERINYGRYGYRLSRDTYALINKRSSTYSRREDVGEAAWAAWDWMYEDDEHRVHTDEWCALQREAALENFDLNMAFFAQIDPEAFEAALEQMLVKTKQLRLVEDLRMLDGVAGAYVMVLDEYRQVYIGSAWDIRKRIKQHWAGTKEFDRLIWGGKHQSVLSIDSFRALDTTRIFAAGTVNGFELEERLERNFPPDYALNRVGGGEITGFRSLFIAGEVKRRGLVPVEEASTES
ncbi:hypothetical protein [Sinomonas sp. G460-2]|uniref:hypothetical protein n=1 Tax=Sinomonas sp. G460-2 TaxID=3393464 RepID=UPI0039EDF3C3